MKHKTYNLKGRYEVKLVFSMYYKQEMKEYIVYNGFIQSTKKPAQHLRFLTDYGLSVHYTSEVLRYIPCGKGCFVETAAHIYYIERVS